MPALRAVIGADSTQFQQELRKSQAYADWWAKSLTNRDVEEASRRNKARALLRQRAAAREAKIEEQSMVKLSNAKLWKGIVADVAVGNLDHAAVKAGFLVNKLGLLKYLVNPVTAIAAGLVAGFAAAYKLAGALTDRLAGLKLPDLKVAYIAKHLQAINAVAEAHKEINKEVQKTIELYNSAANRAERMRKETKEKYDHERKMDDLLNHGRNRWKIDEAERKQEQVDKQKEQDMLVREANQKQAQADKIKVSSQPHDQQILEQRKKLAEEAEKYLTESAAAKGTFKEKLIRAYNSVALTGVSGKDLDAAGKANEAEARRRIQAAKEWEDQMAKNDETRKKRDELYNQSKESAAKAATSALELQDMKKQHAIQSKNEKEERDVRPEIKAHLNSLQKQGAYAPGASVSLLDVNKRIERNTAKMAEAMLRKFNEQGQAKF